MLGLQTCRLCRGITSGFSKINIVNVALLLIVECSFQHLDIFWLHSQYSRLKVKKILNSSAGQLRNLLLTLTDHTWLCCNSCSTHLFDSETVCEPAVAWTFLSIVIWGPSLCNTALATQATTGSGGWRGLERIMSNTLSSSMSKLSSSLLFGTTWRYL